MIPIGDDNSDRHRIPFVNYFLLLANIFVFLFYQRFGTDIYFTMSFSTVPAEILTGKDIVTESQQLRDAITGEVFTMPGLQRSPSPVWITLITSMFMHGGWAHLGGNMLYLAIFGDNLENRLGHLRYIFFYLITGVLASLAHVFATVATHGNMLIPSLGASGAISGVLGGYMLLFPGGRVRMLVRGGTTEMPAWTSIGLWFVFQLVAGMGMLGSGSQAGGVAYGAHIGGF